MSSSQSAEVVGKREQFVADEWKQRQGWVIRTISSVGHGEAKV